MASPQRHQKRNHRGKWRNPKSHSVCLQLHCASCDATVRSSKLDVHLACCLLTQVGPITSTSDFNTTFSWCQRETASDSEVALQKEAIYRCVLRNGVYFWRVSSRNQDKSFHQARRKWGSLQTGLSQAFREASGMQPVWTLTSLFLLLCCHQKKVFLHKRWPQSRQLCPSPGRAGPAVGVPRAAAGLCCPRHPPTSPAQVPLLSP